ncbi:MAG: isoleucine--tRNA ligase [Candidatus Aenigmarchaeota archaeon]|nr:isoleucine--tRNA ligase [Candidatus Aenigmarchaeota archaeon]
MPRSFAERETAILRDWEERKIYEKAKKLREGGKKFYFLQGPPFTSGEAHLGHAWNHSIKDAVIRQRRMLGHSVYDRAGWDCHGLPIELKVEQKLGMKSKRDIDSVGMERFAAECQSFVEWSIGKMTATFKRMAVWLDWDDPYLTYKDSYMESVWFMIKKAHEKGLLYKGERVVSWCWRCVTALAANYEVEYSEVDDPSIFVKFPVAGSQATKVLECISGSKIKLKYEHPLLSQVPIHKTFEKAHFVVSGTTVTLEDGSGCVHTAPGHGKDDFDIGKQNSLPVFCPVDENGKFTDAAGKYKGMFVKDADKTIIDDLEAGGLLVGSGKIKHNYLHCERCKQPIIYRATEQWFIAVSKIRDKLIAENRKISWTPEFIGINRFGKWLEGIEDWCISRQRYWNTPLPIWKCSENHVTVVGSVAELKKLSGQTPENLHRPWIDRVKIKCHCRRDATRVTDVMDVWLDSGSASWATLGYPSAEKKFKEMWPADFITEGSDQTRGWFYSLLGCSVVAFDKASYKNVLYHGFTLDSDGRKMSKSLGNVVSPEEFSEKYGVDVMRFYLCSSVPWDDLKFVWDDVKQVERFLNILWNVFEFYNTYSKASGISHPNPGNRKKEDEWILSSLSRLNEDVSRAHEKFLPHQFTVPIEKFVIEDLSRVYVKMIRARTWPAYAGKDKEAAFYTLREALLSVSKIIAPVCPFIAEDIYLGLHGGRESVHLEDWPKPGKRNASLEDAMNAADEIIETINSIRQEKGIGLRYPVKEAVVSCDKELAAKLQDAQSAISELGNVKKISFGEAKFDFDVKLNFAVAGKRFGKKVREITDELAKSDKKHVANEVDKKGFVMFSGEKLGKDDLKIEKKIPQGLAGKVFSGGMVYLDTDETREILEESFVRELIRNIQEERKNKALKVGQVITVSIGCDSEAKRIVEKAQGEIMDSTGTAKIMFSSDRKELASEYKGLRCTFEIKLDGHG